MNKIKLNVFAKANLSLNITGKTEGLHLIDGIFVSLDAFDTVTVSERTDDKIRVRFVNADVDPIDNTAYKAATAVREVFPFGCDITVEKGIPIAAGLGGSSADGAATLRALDLFYRLPKRGIDMRSLALAIGSDVPFMLTGGTARVSGIGGELYFIKNKLPLFAIGLMAGAVSTKECYETFDSMYGGSSYAPTDNDLLAERLMSGDKTALEHFGNALSEPAATLSNLTALRDKLEAAGGVPCLTGSGGMVLGWFTDIEKFATAAATLKNESGFKAFTTVDTGILHERI